jgi:HEAT repeat protein
MRPIAPSQFCNIRVLLGAATFLTAAAVTLTVLTTEANAQEKSARREKPMEETQILKWAREAPLMDPVKLRASPNFSYEEWIARGHKLPNVVETVVRRLEQENLQKPSGDGMRLAYALGLLGDRRRQAQDALVRCIASNDIELRSTSAAALGSIGDASVVALLESLVRDRRQDKSVRGNACVSIGRLGARSAESVLRDALDDPEPFVVLCAKEGLKLLHRNGELLR